MKNINSTAKIYVDCVNGNEWYSGISTDIHSDSGPVKTIETALARVRELRVGRCDHPVTISIMGGEYFLDKEINIGRMMSDITIEGHGDKKAVIRGAKKIEGFYEAEMCGVKCLAAKIPEGVIPSDLFVNGKRAVLPRFPEEGFLYPIESESKTKALHDRAEWFIAEKGVFDNLSHPEEVSVNFNHYWVDEHAGIESYDSETGKVTMTKTTAFTIYSSIKGSENIGNSNAEYSTMEYYLENVREMFKKTNQYFIDIETNTLYYIPENDGEFEAYMPTVKAMFNVEADNVCFRNLTFEYSSSEYESSMVDERTGKGLACDSQAVCGANALINFKNSANCRVEDCELLHYGLYGVQIGLGSHRVRVCGNVFDDCGAGGVKIEGGNNPDFDGDETYGNTVNDNKITNCGIKFEAGCGVLIMHSYENVISHNEIAYTYYTGISCGWVWGYVFSKSHDNIIEKNHIHHIGQGHLSDMGGIYILGAQKGTVLRGNLIHDTRCRYYGGQAIYLDEGASYVTVENNICYNVDAGSLQQHFGFMNIVKNNIFDAGEHGCTLHWLQEMHTGFVSERNILFTRNSLPVYGSSGEDVLADCFCSDYNLIYAFDDEEPIFYRQYGLEKHKADAEAEHELDKHSIIADPLFVDAENHDYRLKENSPAYEIGFVDIDMSDVGVRK